MCVCACVRACVRACACVCAWKGKKDDRGRTCSPTVTTEDRVRIYFNEGIVAEEYYCVSYVSYYDEYE